MKKGDVLRGKEGSDAIHPIVFLRDQDKNFFIGAMLTTSDYYADNILMSETHFKKEYSNGKKCKLCFKKTHLVNTELIKRDAWKPFVKVGELTDEGIKFVESKIGDKKPVLWEEYLNTEQTNKKYLHRLNLSLIK